MLKTDTVKFSVVAVFVFDIKRLQLTKNERAENTEY